MELAAGIVPRAERGLRRLDSGMPTEETTSTGADLLPAGGPQAKCAEDVLLSLQMPIAVVGNGTPTRSWGQAIDRYASIIRLNNFRTDGFEALVGRRTHVRCTSGWRDIEHRSSRYVEISPFTATARESANLQTFNAANARPILPAATDVKPHISEVPNPSTGLALVQLLGLLGMPVDLYGFDGFRSAHYWTNEQETTSHSQREMEALLTRSHVALYSDIGQRDLASTTRHFSADEAWLWLKDRGDVNFKGQSVLTVGLGPRGSEELLKQGARITSIASSAGERDRFAPAGATGCVSDLALVDESFDCGISLGHLDTLSANACRIFIRQAARLCPRLLMTVQTSDDGHVLSGTSTSQLRRLSWWRELASEFYDVTVLPCVHAGSYALYARRRERLARPCGL